MPIAIGKGSSPCGGAKKGSVYWAFFFLLMHFVYIIYSKKIDRFYIGQTHDVNDRILKHNSLYYPNKWTAKGIPLILFHQIACASKSQALLIEKHIKSMKSTMYLKNLKRYPEISDRLKKKYKAG